MSDNFGPLDTRLPYEEGTAHIFYALRNQRILPPQFHVLFRIFIAKSSNAHSECWCGCLKNLIEQLVCLVDPDGKPHHIYNLGAVKSTYTRQETDKNHPAYLRGVVYG